VRVEAADYSDRLVIELWGPSLPGVAAIPNVVKSLLTNQPIQPYQMQEFCATPSFTKSPPFVVRLKYVRVEPLSNKITMVPVALPRCAMDCPVKQFIDIHAPRVPLNVPEMCQDQPEVNMASVLNAWNTQAARGDASQPAPPASPTGIPNSWTTFNRETPPSTSTSTPTLTYPPPTAIPLPPTLAPEAVSAMVQDPSASDAIEGPAGMALYAVVTVGRHGDRSPRFGNAPIDAAKQSSLSEPLWLHKGKLTERGFAQEYAVGRWLRKQYLPQLSAQTFRYCKEALRSLVSVRSLNLNRTFASGLAFTAGLLDMIEDGQSLLEERASSINPPLDQCHHLAHLVTAQNAVPPKVQLPANLHYQPLKQLLGDVVRRAKRRQDRLLNGALSSTCPALRRLRKELVTSHPHWRKALRNRKNLKFFQKISAVSKMKVRLNTKLLRLYDHMKGMLRHGHGDLLPEDLRTEFAVRNVEKLVEFMHRKQYRPAPIAELVAGPLLGQIVEHIAKATQEFCDRASPSAVSCSASAADVRAALASGPAVAPRLHHYISDDATLTSLLALLKFLGRKGLGWTPDYSDRLIIEVWGESGAGKPSIPLLVSGMMSGTAHQSKDYMTNCHTHTPPFIVRFKYMRVDPMTNKITLQSLTHTECATDCALVDLKGLLERHVPKDIAARCAETEAPNVAQVMAQLPPDANAAVVPPPAPAPGPANDAAPPAADPQAEPLTWQGGAAVTVAAPTERPAVESPEAPKAPTTAKNYDHLQLHSVFTIGRHGDRSPRQRVLPDAKGARTAKWLHMGRLTARGFQQEYAIGRFLRATYLPAMPFPNGDGYCRAGLESLVSFRALNLNRTAASAYALAAGLLDTIPDASHLLNEYQNGAKPSHMLEAILTAKDKTYVVDWLP
jgi:hypothetical protein